ncbi:MAG: twin-arginine translocation signal domain-containing protein [Flavobacteriales bacterium]|nr:MAG: twin-arginine translocation signal domain-containing protein [Flavobacteriales bacterium]
MDRRNFIKRAGAAAAGAFVMPYILPSGRLFAASGGGGGAQHVVLVMFAGGVRQQESIGMRYLADAQNEMYEGNIMYNMLNGQAPGQKIVYGTGLGGINPIPGLLNTTLESQGTLFAEMRAVNAGHYGGLNSLLQGSQATTQGLTQKPLNPTIFEYLRRHAGLPATKTWFIGNTIGNSVPLLNYSIHPQYGARYGANFFAPNITFGPLGDQYLSNAKVYHPQDQLAPMYEMKAFLDNSFENVGNVATGIGNTPDEKQDIKAFMVEMFSKTANGTVAHPPVHDNGDAQTVGYACEVMKWFKPALTVVNMSSVDGCHGSFTGYLASLHRADHSVGHLWNYIQTQIPEIAGNTTLIVVPECGRNDQPNAIRDENDWFGYDHSDANALRIFGMMVGAGVQSNLRIGSEGSPVGIATDVVPTIAELLGVKNEVMSAGLIDAGSLSLFDRI